MVIIKIFISSPSDVKAEREIAKEVIENLKVEFEEEIVFDVYLYEEHHQTASRGDFQAQINHDLESSDIAIFIIWSRLGSPMSSYIGHLSGKKGVTGTEYEFETALKLYEDNGKPEIFVYRKIKEIALPPQKESHEYQQKFKEIEEVNSFFQNWFKNEHNSIKRAFYEFKETDELKTYLHNHIKSIILEQKYKKAKVIHPYKGLSSFDFEDRVIFFGRDDEIKAFFKEWKKEPFIVVFGPSGSGKSSFIKAGILPYLLKEESGEFLVTRPVELSLNPFEALRKKFFQKYENSFKALTYTKEDLQKRFENLDILPLQQVLQDKRFYLILDQFEEIINTSKELQERYLEFLQLCTKGLNIFILATIRTNSLDIIEESPVFRAIEKFTYRLTFPSPSNIMHIIKKPAELANLAFEVDPAQKKRLDKILAEEVIKDVSALPLLEFALTQLEKKKVFKKNRYYLTIDAYKAIGELQGAIATLAQQTYEELNEKEKVIFEKLLVKLVSIKDDHLILADYVPKEEERAVVQRFVEARLFVQENEYIRVAHEAFFRYWDFAKKVFENNKADLIQRDRIEQAYRLYQEQNRSKKALLQGSLLLIAKEILKKRGEEFFDSSFDDVPVFIQKSIKHRRRRNFLIAFSVFAVIVMLISLSVYSISQWQRAQESLEIAQNEREKAIKAKNAALTAKKEAEENRKLALAREESLRVFIQNLIYNLAAERTDINKTAEAIASASVQTINIKADKDYYIAEVLIDKSKALETKIDKKNWKKLLHLMTDEQIKKLLEILYRERLELDIIKIKQKSVIKRIVNKSIKFSNLIKTLKISELTLNAYKRLVITEKECPSCYKFFKKGQYKKAIECIHLYIINAYIHKKNKFFISDLGHLSWYALFAKDYDLAIAAAKYALKLDPSQIWIYTNLAHAYLFKGELKKAKEIYLKYCNKKIGKELWQEVILNDFKELTKKGFDNPKFKDIKKLLKSCKPKNSPIK